MSAKKRSVKHRKNGKRYVKNPTKRLAKKSTQKKIAAAGKAFDKINAKSKGSNGE